jgi:hypothetical protein
MGLSACQEGLYSLELVVFIFLGKHLVLNVSLNSLPRDKYASGLSCVLFYKLLLWGECGECTTNIYSETCV